MSNIEFISYTGKYPNLCSGVLTLKIDDKIVHFGYEEDYEPFWESGGRCGFDGDGGYCYGGEWVIDGYSDLKEAFNIDASHNEVATAIRDCSINLNSFTM